MNLQEIAKMANVSSATVSNALSNKSGVSDKTREKIIKIANENGYKQYGRMKSANLFGNIRFLKYQDTDLIIDESTEYISEIIEETELALRLQGFNLLMTSYLNKNNFEEIFLMMRKTLPQGVILLGSELCPDISEELLKFNIPLVVIDNSMPYYNINCVQPNNKEITMDAIKYLSSRGYKTIGHIRSRFQINKFKERNEGFRQGLLSNNLPYFPGYEFMVTPTVSDSCNELESIFLETPLLPNVFFCDSDNIAIGAIKALQKLGYKVPKDVSIMGFGDLPSSAIFDPTLTTMKVDMLEIAKLAVQLLLDNINSKKNNIAKIQVSAQLIVRNSTK